MCVCVGVCLCVCVCVLVNASVPQLLVQFHEKSSKQNCFSILKSVFL